MIVGLYGVSLCALMPSVLCIDGFGELGEQVIFHFEIGIICTFKALIFYTVEQRLY